MINRFFQLASMLLACQFCIVSTAQQLSASTELNTRIRRLVVPMTYQDQSLCSFQFFDSNFPQLDDDNYFRLEKFPLKSIRCYSSSDTIVTNIAKQNEDTQQWEVDRERFIEQGSSNEEEQWSYLWSPENYPIVQLKSINGSGYAIIDSTLIDRGVYQSKNRKFASYSRPIYLTYCLLHPPKALCGSDLMGDKQKSSKNDMTPVALKILRSIEFTD